VLFVFNQLLGHVAVCQNLVPLVNIKIAGKWMFIPLKMVLIGIDPYPCFGSLIQVAWIVLLGVLCLIDGIIQMLEPQSSTRDPKLAQECRQVYQRHHGASVEVVA